MKSYYKIKKDAQSLNEDKLNISKGSEDENKPLHLMIDIGSISSLDPRLKTDNNQTMGASNNNMTDQGEENHLKASQMKDSKERSLPQVDSSNNNLTIVRSKNTSTDCDQDEDKAFKLKLAMCLWGKWVTHEVILTESKISNLQLFNAHTVWSKKGIKWMSLPSIGSSGDIIVIWNDFKYKVINTKLGIHSVSINFSNSTGHWWLTSVYGPSKSIDRSIFWNELTILQQHCLPYWLLAGDFNIFRWKSETNAKNLDTRNMAFFNDFIQANELIDPPLTNNNFTWSNLRINPTFSHLDRFLYIPQ
ncbi:hypothetical protein E5676_scaffold808G00180 [Cucumis melo var. makuwa]|uniref:Reverse transcriptase n=1 Tax=Cucumis melo var. makuwa TaxID=1194695 RepID=A0A5A7T7L9_CUCMM|nr:hypothetical protein E6C27_scaffold277G00430 [Cucumis melo var. makuwa]TYK01930.1 hypothetical protein E5676_scaffold808G00180 [Cucumis melo var. makuwa]